MANSRPAIFPSQIPAAWRNDSAPPRECTGKPWDLAEHQARVRELVRKYANQPMDLADACLVAMSEEWWECKVITVDITDFRVYRRRGRHPIPLLTPETTSGAPRMANPPSTRRSRLV